MEGEGNSGPSDSQDGGVAPAGPRNKKDEEGLEGNSFLCVRIDFNIIKMKWRTGRTINTERFAAYSKSLLCYPSNKAAARLAADKNNQITKGEKNV